MERIRRLISDLDSDNFATREAATDALEQFGMEAEPQLREALAAKPSGEMRKRNDALLTDLHLVRSQEVARQIRAVQVLECIDSPEAWRHKKTLAGGAPASRLTQEAKVALKRKTGSIR